MRKIIKNILKVLIALVLIATVAFFAYTSDYYQMDNEVTRYLLNDEDTVNISYQGDTIIFEGETSEYGLIFYPGGKVDYRAYAPLMSKLAEKGVLCILVKMPGNLAILNVDAADGYQALYPNVKHWYMGGHSLGGACASKYIGKHVSAFDGLILLGSYAAEDLSKTNIDVILLYGENDRVLNKDKYDEAKSLIPSSYYEHVIGGGIHSYFGMYGIQDGDGVPTISNETQMDVTVDYIMGRISK